MHSESRSAGDSIAGGANLASARAGTSAWSGQALVRYLFLVHRYLGIGVGVLMATWCLSGIVMMYVPFPQLDAADRIGALAPIDWSRCCTLRGSGAPSDDARVARADVEMLAGQPVARLQLVDGSASIIELTRGQRLEAVLPWQAMSVAGRYAGSRGLSTEASAYRHIDYDQWTVGGFRADRPLHWIALNDAAGTELYVSSHTGKLIQLTTSSQRFWSWLGAVPHWLYPSLLRSRPAAWSQVVIWTSLLGTFLTATGLYIGIRQLGRKRNGGSLSSPYRGVMFFHHVPGVIFGLFALTWVLSGLLSMNPWGLLEGEGIADDSARLKGAAPTFIQVEDWLRHLPQDSLQRAVSVELTPLAGHFFTMATSADGSRTRFDSEGSPRSLGAQEIQSAALRIAGPGASWQLLTKEDAYHYSVMRQYAQLPAIRVASGSESPTYYYLDPTSGALIDKADAGGKSYRWWHSGLHRLDFAPALRTSIARNLLMLPLLIGAALLCATGAYIGIRRLTR